MRAAGLVVVGSNKKCPKIDEILLARLQAKVNDLTTRASELPVRAQSKRARLKATRQQYVQKIEEHKRANGRLAQVHPRTPQIHATHSTGVVARSPTSARRHWLAALRARNKANRSPAAPRTEGCEPDVRGVRKVRKIKRAEAESCWTRMTNARLRVLKRHMSKRARPQRCPWSTVIT